MSVGWGIGRARVLAWLLIAGAICIAIPARAESSAPPPPPQGVGPREIWVGADAGASNWLVYSGSTYAPWSDIHADGFRLRTTAGYGQYTYDFDSTHKVRATKSYADVLAGYEMRFGELTAKAFLGYAFLSQDFEVPQTGWRAHRVDTGLKGALELWLNIGEHAWTSFDANYADTRETWSLRSRVGYRILPTVSVGPEAVFNHTDLAGEVAATGGASLKGNMRFGAFVRYEWFGGEISASGGYSGDWIESSKGGMDVLHDPQLYGTLNFIVQF